MKIAIDPGHGMANVRPGVYDPGAVANVGGEHFAEADFTLRYALTLRHFLQQMGIPDFMTRTSSAQPAPVRQRVVDAVNNGCTHFISFHMNAAGPTATGTETLYRNANSAGFATLIQLSVAEATGLRDRGIKPRNDLAVLRFPGPAVLIELGFISNALDRGVLLPREMRIEVAKAIVMVLIED